MSLKAGSHVITGLVLIGVLGVSGCGQKGPLYLPETPGSQKAAAEKPADAMEGETMEKKEAEDAVEGEAENAAQPTS